MTAFLQFAAEFQTPALAVPYLRRKNILRANPPLCSRADCQRTMTEIKDAARIDGVIWRCPSHKGIKKSVRAGSFLENSKLTLDQFISLTYMWALGSPTYIQEDIVGLSRETVVQWNQYYRDVCSRFLLAHPIRLGGIGQIVEIDESLVAKRKYNRGHLVPEKWVFGLYDVQKKIGVLEFVEERNRETLLPIIERTVLPGSIIHSDCWAAYGGGVIAAIPVVPPYEHYMVNHSENFVDPETGACTNHIESFWKRAKAKNKQMNGTSQEMLPSYFDEFMWRQQFGNYSREAFHHILNHIAEFYPVN